MEATQPNQTLTNIALDLQRLAARADRLVPTLPADAAHELTQSSFLSGVWGGSAAPNNSFSRLCCGSFERSSAWRSDSAPSN